MRDRLRYTPPFHDGPPDILKVEPAPDQHARERNRIAIEEGPSQLGHRSVRNVME